MKKPGNEAGVTLLTALMFIAICLVMIVALVQMLLVGTETSGSQKNYRNSLEASYSGAELVTKEFIPRLFPNYSTGLGPLLGTFSGTGAGQINLVVNKANLKEKLGHPTADWGPLSKTLDPKDTPDLQFQLKSNTSGSNYNVYTKIVDTVQGNSDTTGIDYIDSGAGVAGGGAGIGIKHNPSLYTLEVRAERADNAKEKALLSVLYAY